MAHQANRTLQLLREGSLALGIGIRSCRTPDAARIFDAAGYDWLFIDLEHGPCTIENVYNICAGALSTNVTPLVRVPKGHIGLAARCLDSGAMGVILSHVESYKEAEAAVRGLRLPPRGERSVGGMYPQLEFATRPSLEMLGALDDRILCAAMIESRAGVENAYSIASVPGIDILMVGINDLTTSLGISGERSDQTLFTIFDEITAAAKRAGKIIAFGGISDPVLASRLVKRGAQMVLCGSDLAFLIGAAKKQSEAIRAAVQN